MEGRKYVEESSGLQVSMYLTAVGMGREREGTASQVAATTPIIKHPLTNSHHRPPVPSVQEKGWGVYSVQRRWSIGGKEAASISLKGEKGRRLVSQGAFGLVCSIFPGRWSP